MSRVGKHMSQRKRGRNSSVELLRIIAMLMITSHHYLLGSDVYVMSQPFSVNKVLMETFLYSGGKIGVVVFFSISAWYLSEKSDVRSSLRRVWILEREVLFWSLCGLAATVATFPQELTPLLVIKSVFPVASDLWWYATAYCVFLLVFPCLIPALRYLGRRRHAYLAMGLFVLWTILQGFVPLFFLGLPGGNFLSFVYLYILISYYRWYLQPMSVKVAWITLLTGYLLIAFSAVAGGLVYQFLGTGDKIQTVFVSTEYKLPTMMVGFSLFVLFVNSEFHSRIVNAIASSSFAVYLITDYPTIYQHIWHGPLQLSRFYNSPFAVLIVLGIVILAYGTCAVLDHIRRLLFMLTIDRHRGKWFDVLWKKLVVSRIAYSGENGVRNETRID